MVRCNKKAARWAACEHVEGPRALRNDDDAGGEGVVRVPAHRHHSSESGGERQSHPAEMGVGDARGDARMLGTTLCTRCARAVDGAMFPGDQRKVRWITLCIQNYLLTSGFASAKVCSVPGSARTPGPRDRVFRDRPSGRSRRKTDPAHDAEAGPVRGEKPPASRTIRRFAGGETWKFTPNGGRRSTPTAPEAEGRRRQRWHGQPGQRERRREGNGAGFARRTGSSNSGDGGRATGRRNRGGTVAGSAGGWRRGATAPGSPGETGPRLR